MESLKDTLATLPWLLGIYIALEFLENRSESFLGDKISHKPSVGPFLGALLGCMPQCGFSVIAATLYTRRCISLGTLIAVFVSTSDEAIPVILSQHNKAPLVLWLLLTKVILATVAGYLINLVFHKKIPKPYHSTHAPVVPEGGHRYCDCHAHGSEVPRWKTFVLFPLKHTFKVLFFIFAVSLAIGLLAAKFGAACMDRDARGTHPELRDLRRDHPDLSQRRHHVRLRDRGSLGERRPGVAGPPEGEQGRQRERPHRRPAYFRQPHRGDCH